MRYQNNKLNVVKKFFIFFLIFSFAFFDFFNLPLNFLQKNKTADHLASGFKIQDASAGMEGDGVFFSTLNGNTTPQVRQYDALTNSFSVNGDTAAGSQGVITRLKTSPIKDEYIAAYQDSAGLLQVMCFDGISWTNEWSIAVAPSGTPTTRRFDIFYETTSGDVTVVYSRNAAATNALAYRTKSGSTGCGTANWSAATNFPTTTSVTTGTVQWVKADRDGRSGSNLNAVIWADSNQDLGAAIWNSAAFTNFKVLETTLERIAVAQDVDSFELAFESLSGNLMVVWGSGGSATTNGAYYNRCVGGTSACTWTASRTAIPSLLDDATVLDLSSDPLSDKIAFASIGNGGSDLQAAYWSGTAWTGYPNLDTTCETPIAGSRLTQTGWLNNNGITKWVLTYDDASGTGISWRAATPGSASVAQTDWGATPAINDIRGRYDIDTHPFGGSQLMFTLSDSTNNIFAKRLDMDASGNLTWSNADGGASLGTKTSHPQQGFSFQFKRFIPVDLISITTSASAGSQVASLDSSDTSQYINSSACTGDATCAAFKISAADGDAIINSIKVSEVGTVDAYNTLANPVLYIDYDGNYSNGTNGVFGSQTEFASDDTVTFTNAGLTIPSGSTYYFYVRFDLVRTGNYPAGGNTIDFQITSIGDITSNATAGGTFPVVLAGSTAVRPKITSYTNSTEAALNYGAACTYCGARLGPGAPYRQTITINGYGFGADPGLGSRDTASNKVEIVGAQTDVFVDDGSANTNVSAWTNTAITIRTDSNITGNADTDWGTNYGGASALKVTIGGQAAATSLNFHLFPQVISLTVPTAIANAAREYEAGDSEGIVTLNGTRFGSSATGGWVRILGCDASTCSSPTGSVAINSWSSSAIEVQVPPVIADNVYTGSLQMQQGSGTTNRTHLYTSTGFRILPRITSFEPSSEAVGGEVVINGNHLCQNGGTCPSAFDVNNRVVFSTDVDATVFTNWSNTIVTTAVPSGALNGDVYLVSNTYNSNGKPFGVLTPIPNDPISLNQYIDASLTAPLVTGDTASSTNLYLTMEMQTGSAGGTLYPQIEYKPIGTAFSCTGASACAQAVEGTGVAGPGPIDCSATGNGCAITITPSDDVFHWQARIRHFYGGSSYYSDWISYGANGENATDFKVDKVPPVISFAGGNTCNDAVSQLSTNGATISWSLNENATGQIEYSKNSNLSGSTLSAVSPSNSFHSFDLNNLDSNTTYYFQVKSVDSAGNTAYRPTVSPYCSFTTTNVTQPAKTIKFFVASVGSTITGGSATSTDFSIYVPENSVSVKSAFLELSGHSSVNGTNNVAISVNSQATSTYAVASNGNAFRVLYKVDPANINFDPVDNTLSLNPSSDLNISSAVLFLTYSFAP